MAGFAIRAVCEFKRRDPDSTKWLVTEEMLMHEIAPSEGSEGEARREGQEFEEDWVSGVRNRSNSPAASSPSYAPGWSRCFDTETKIWSGDRTWSSGRDGASPGPI